MKTVSKLLIITGKIVLSIILGLVTTTAIIAALDIGFGVCSDKMFLWLAGVILAVSILMFSWLMLRTPSRKNIKTPGIDDLPSSAVELIDNIITSMRYSKSVCAEVKQELADHFTDTLYGCKTDDEKAKCVSEMADAFGDPKLLGVLVKRGKKRCRPLWQKVLAGIPLAIGCGTVVLALYIGWFFMGKPAVTVDYLAIWNEQVRPAANNDENAEPFYSMAAEAFNADVIEATEEINEKRFDESPRSLSTLSEDELEVIKHWVADNDETLKFVRQGNAKPYFWISYSPANKESTEVISILMPGLGKHKRMAQILCWQGLLQADNGQTQEAFESVNQAYLFGSHIRGQKNSLIEQLVAMAIESMANKTLRIILSDNYNKLDNALLTKTAKEFERMITNKDFRLNISGEKLFMYDEAQRCFVESKIGRDHLYLPRLDMLSGKEFTTELLSAKAVKVLFSHPDKEETLKTVDKYYDALDELVDKTPATLKIEGDPMRQLTEDLCRGNIFLEILMPAMGKCAEKSHKTRTDAQATLTVIAILRYHKQNSVFPENLRVLVDSGLLTEIPIDPFSDKTLIYRKTDGDFTLYSVGSDFEDDGGVETEERKEDRVFWPTGN